MIKFFEANIGFLFFAIFFVIFLIAFVLTLILSKKSGKRVLSCKSYLYHADMKKIKNDEIECETGNIPLSLKSYDCILSSGIEIRKEGRIKLVDGNYEI